jgi:hypothetical protein
MKSLLHACQQALYLSLKSSSSISPTRIPFLPVLSISWSNTFKVEPISLPFDASEAASNKRCVGKIKCAFLEMINLLLMSKLNFSSPSISFENYRIYNYVSNYVYSCMKIPEGMVLSTCFIPSNSKVCPAFGPLENEQ